MEFEFSENVNVLFERLEKFFASKTIIGDSIQVGEITIIPLLSISFGLGTGSASGTDPKSKQEGEGIGGGVGVKASPSAIIIIKGGEIQVMPIGASGSFEKLVEILPEMVSKVKGEEKDTDKDK